MVARLYVASAEGRTGKSVVAAGMLDHLGRAGRRVGVFRPLVRAGSGHDVILDALLEHAPAARPYSSCIATDYERLHHDPDDALRLVVERADAAEAGCDALLVIGSDYTDVVTPAELATNARIAASLGAGVVLVLGGRADGGEPRSRDEVAEAAEIAIAELRAEHAAVIAIVVTRADPADLTSVGTELRQRIPGIPAWTLPDDPALVSPLLERMLDAVDARLLAGESGRLSRSVRDVVIGTSSLESTLRAMTEDALLLTSGDRADLVLGAVLADASETFPRLSGILLCDGEAIPPDSARLIGELGTSIPIAVCDARASEATSRLLATRSRLIADSPRKYDAAVRLFGAHVDADAFLAALAVGIPPVRTPARFEHELVVRARERPMRILLPESDDDRVLTAAGIVARRGIAKVTLLGDETAVRRRAETLGVELEGVAIATTKDATLRSRLATEFHELRAHKGVTSEAADLAMEDPTYFATMMVRTGLADGMVSGARHTTADTVRPAFEIIRTAPGVSVVSSSFLMALADRVLVYADCAILARPTAEQLSDIAVSSAATARLFGIEPVIAMLSYSTGTSGTGADVERVRIATELVRRRDPGLPVVGPIQYDAAADPVVAAAKWPGSAVAGHATVFVFPDLDTGNVSYKAVQRTAGAIAIGPVLQGLAKPVNDLSRGATVRDIVNTVAITSIQAGAGR